MKYHILILPLLIFSACKSDTIDNSEIVNPPAAVSFSSDVGPLLSASCSGSGCHVGIRTSGVKLDSYDNIVTSIGVQYGKKIIQASNADESPLMDKISPTPDFGSRMPLGRAPLSANQVAILREWINDGALNN